jgi:hypothetical protein
VAPVALAGFALDGVGQLRLLHEDRRPRRRLGIDGDEESGHSVVHVESGGRRLRHGPLRQDHVGQPPGSLRRIDERHEDPLGAGGDGLRRARDEPVAAHPLADRPLAAGALEARRDGLGVPPQPGDPEQLGDPPGELGVAQRLGVPRVEQVEPLLPAPAGALTDPLVRADELRDVLIGGRLIDTGEQLGPGCGVALARLGHARPDESFERLLCGHRVFLSTPGPRHSRWRCPRRKGHVSDRHPESWTPFALTSRWREHRIEGSAMERRR